MNKINRKSNLVLVCGDILTGRTTVCKYFASQFGHKLIDYKEVEASVRKSKGTEEEPFEGEIYTNELNYAFV